MDVALNPFIEPDRTDVNDNFLTHEQMPWDYKKSPRILTGQIGAIVDMGSYEDCPGDVDGNGKVELPDLAIVNACYGGSASCLNGSNCCWADVGDCDGTVNLPDLALVIAHLGEQCDQTGDGGGNGFAAGGEGGGSGDQANRGAGDGGASDEFVDYDGDGEVDGPLVPPSDDPFAQWLRSASLNEVFEWYEAGMPR